MNKNKPRLHITVNSVRALRPSPPNKKLFDWDDEIRGFGAYRTSGGAVVFVYQYRMPHQPARRAKIGEFGDLTPAQARDIARTWAVERRQDSAAIRIVPTVYGDGRRTTSRPNRTTFSENGSTASNGRAKPPSRTDANRSGSLHPMRPMRSGMRGSVGRSKRTCRGGGPTDWWRTCRSSPA